MIQRSKCGTVRSDENTHKNNIHDASFVCLERSVAVIVYDNDDLRSFFTCITNCNNLFTTYTRARPAYTQTQLYGAPDCRFVNVFQFDVNDVHVRM